MLTSILEKAIQIEGLIRILRDGQPSPETYALLKKKTEELAAIAAEMQASTPQPQKVASLKEGGTPKPAAPALLPDNDDIILTFEDEEDEIPETAPASKGAPKAPLHVTFTEKTESAETPAAHETRHSSPKNLKSLFSLNDRYLYSRELFGGNMKMFDATLDFIEGVENYSDIEDYFYSELEWDPENNTAATFLETVRPHFKE